MDVSAWLQSPYFARMSGAAQSALVNLSKPTPKRAPKVAPGTAPLPPQPGRCLNGPDNVLVNNPAEDGTSPADTQSETALVKGRGAKLVAAYNDSFSFTIARNSFTGYSVSADHGQSWTDKGLGPIPSGGGEANNLGDPVLARDNASGVIHFCSIAFTGPMDTFRIGTTRSSNDGATWGRAVVIGPPGNFLDKPWIAVDNSGQATQGTVYVTFTLFPAKTSVDVLGIYLFVSTDGGLHFQPAGGALASALVATSFAVQGSQVAVGPDGAVHVMWYEQGSYGGPAALKTRRYVALGLKPTSPVAVANLTSLQDNGDLSLNGFRSNSFPIVAVHPKSGHLYAVYNDCDAFFGGDRGNIFFVQSTDAGATWTTPHKVNDDRTTRTQFQPSIAVRPNGTALAICWYDCRDDPNNQLMARWGVTARIQRQNVKFGRNFCISPQFPPVFGVDPLVNPRYMGDYDQMAADNKFFYTTWGDNRDPSRGHLATNANVRFAKFELR